MPEAIISLASVQASTLLASSVVAAVIAAASSFLTQRYLMLRKEAIDYKLPARQRLYQTLGPLRLQLIFAARDVARRIDQHPHPDNKRGWNLDPNGYYVRSFVWRILRPLAVAMLVERQLTVADFTVDPEALELLRLNAAMEEMLTGGEPLLDHPKADWSRQTDHLFGDNLRSAAAALFAAADDGGVRVIAYDEFDRSFPELHAEPRLARLAEIFAACNAEHYLTANPIFWIRLVGYAYVCNTLVLTQGAHLGFVGKSLDVTALLAHADDDHIQAHLSEFLPRFEVILARSL